MTLLSPGQNLMRPELTCGLLAGLFVPGKQLTTFSVVTAFEVFITYLLQFIVGPIYNFYYFNSFQY